MQVLAESVETGGAVQEAVQSWHRSDRGERRSGRGAGQQPSLRSPPQRQGVALTWGRPTAALAWSRAWMLGEVERKGTENRQGARTWQSLRENTPFPGDERQGLVGRGAEEKRDGDGHLPDLDLI